MDESGDHSLAKIDSNYPIFVLSFCIFYQDNYINNIVSEVEKLKFEKFGHDIVILHERDIRKETGLFRFRNRDEKNDFIGRLTSIIEKSNFILISSIIDKRSLTADSEISDNPYHIALGMCLEALSQLLREKQQQNLTTHIVFESRGKKEDRELELEFRRICAGSNRREEKLPFEIIMADKKVNSAGLQLADLVARPIGINYLKPSQSNKAFDILEKKFFCDGGRDNVGNDYLNWGLNIYPPPKSEKPR